MEYKLYKHRLIFKFNAGTSRGILTHKDTWFIKLWRKENPEIFGLGECSPLSGLSWEFNENYENNIEEELNRIITDISESDNLKLSDLSNITIPSLRFGLETAILDLKNGGIRKIFDTGFYQGKKPIDINGLVWMGEKDFMLKQIMQKIEQGFDCIKIKVGAINIDDELNILKYIRDQFSVAEITIRLDANGAFTDKNVFHILDEFSKFGIHSIEQPVKPGQTELLAKVCSQSPIPIAIDEELIGVSDKEILLDKIRPQFIIIKPSLLGGIEESLDWINKAKEKNIGWWNTSLLESNIGLNAITQFASSLNTTLPQGLGTGQLYTNNILSPLVVNNGKINYNPQLNWDLKLFTKK